MMLISNTTLLEISALTRETAIMTLAPTLTTLDSLPVGKSGTVIHLAPGEQAEAGIDVSRRLMELGFVPGERIRVRGDKAKPSIVAEVVDRGVVRLPGFN